MDMDTFGTSSDEDWPCRPLWRGSFHALGIVSAGKVHELVGVEESFEAFIATSGPALEAALAQLIARLAARGMPLCCSYSYTYMT